MIIFHSKHYHDRKLLMPHFCIVIIYIPLTVGYRALLILIPFRVSVPQIFTLRMARRVGPTPPCVSWVAVQLWIPSARPYLAATRLPQTPAVSRSTTYQAR